ncbi:MAG: cycloartenol synthase, partial [Verrucomicrobiota bacterium]
MAAKERKERKMKTLIIFSLVCSWCSLAADIPAAEPKFSKAALAKTDVSFCNEVQHAIDQGISWLGKNQNTNGYWSTADHPAVTALALTAFMGVPGERVQTNASVNKGYAFLLSCVQPDGGIYQKELQNYNTALGLLALVAAKRSEYRPTIRNARQWLFGQQINLGEKEKIDSPFDGGIGYGTHGPRSDMNNTYTALEALYYSKDFDTDKNVSGAKDLNWKAVLNFLQSCQNLPAYNKETWASDDAKNKGGFVYDPSESKAGSETNASGKVALRSYGSISYAGLLSYIYADLKRDDPRVLAVMDWLAQNFSLEENPGMGEQGYYYYLHLMTKALSASGVDTVELKDGKKIDWRKEIAMKLINLQKDDGSWANQNGRWWEKDAALVTSYAV